LIYVEPIVCADGCSYSIDGKFFEHKEIFPIEKTRWIDVPSGFSDAKTDHSSSE